MIGLGLVTMKRLQLLVHQGLDLVRLGIADDDEARVVAGECCQRLVVEHLRKGGEDRGFRRIVDMGLDAAAAVEAKLAHEHVEHGEHVKMITLLGRLVEDGLDHRLASVLDRVDRVGDDERAERRAADDDEFPRLPHNVKVATHRGKASQDAAERNNHTDDEIHRVTPSSC